MDVPPPARRRARCDVGLRERRAADILTSYRCQIHRVPRGSARIGATQSRSPPQIAAGHSADGMRVMTEPSCSKWPVRKRHLPDCDSDWRRLRHRKEREDLAHKLEIVLANRADVRRFCFWGLEKLPLYKAWARQGLAHATVQRGDSSFVVLAATSRFYKKSQLRRALFSIKEAAKVRGLRIVLATPTALLREIHRIHQGHVRPHVRHSHERSAVAAATDAHAAAPAERSYHSASVRGLGAGIL